MKRPSKKKKIEDTTILDVESIESAKQIVDGLSDSDIEEVLNIMSENSINDLLEDKACKGDTEAERLLKERINSEDIGLKTNRIYCGDTVETMSKIKDGSIDMILTSPPYLASIRKDNHKYPGAKNIIKDNQSVNDYLKWMVDVFKQYERILKDDGIIAFNFSYTTFNPSLPYDLINEVFKHTGFRIYDTISWKKKSAVPISGHPNRLTRIVEMVYIFAKTPDFYANKEVKSVSKTGQKYFAGYYNFIEAKNNDGKVDGHEATFSSDLATFFIELYSKENDIILDNFVGTGTTPYASAKLNRRYIGIDLVEDYCQHSRDRISKLYKIEKSE
jgi:DNA modification methylase